ncbi:hypothetical protein GCM10009641_47030 [Mycobacterium cookii]|uniref:Transposase n=1 Tax=Nocardioides furvisabuli TaxID=375542 RepID=A0ABP5JB52_9ACTN|nr:hypothetical protein [Nocardioides furvisabuli]
MSPQRRYAGTLPRIRAVLSHRAIYEIGGELQPESAVGRPPAHPAYVLLIFATLARIMRSTIRVETDLMDPDTWRLIRGLMVNTLEREGLDLPEPGLHPPAWHHWRRLRDDHLATEEGLAHIARLHLPRAVDLAQRLDLLTPRGPSSLTHPGAERAIYGDGTIVRPIYRPPETVKITGDDGAETTWFINPHTKEPQEAPPHRYDADIARHEGHAGPALGHGYVAWHTRAKRPYGRVMLHLGHIDHPGGEAATAVALLRDIHRVAGQAIQIVIYDGAFRGIHLDEIMRDFGYLAIAKQPTFSDEELATTTLVRTSDGRRVRSMPLGVVTHVTINGECHHTLAAINGAVAQLDLDETGDPVVVSYPARGAIKRARRSHGQFHFNIGYRVACVHGDFDTWLTPHSRGPGDSRPEALRAFPDGDPDTPRLRGLRSDAESAHSGFKRTLITERAMALGWRRGLLEYYCYAWYSNAMADQAGRVAAQAKGSHTEGAMLRTVHGT